MDKSQKNNSNLDIQKKLMEELALLKAKLKLETEIRKSLEDKVVDPLQNNKDIFQSLIQNSSDIITLVNEIGIISYTSTSILEVLGYTENELVNRNIFEFIHPEDVEFTKDKFNNTLDQYGTAEKIECRFLNKNGGYLYLEAQANNQLNNPLIKKFVINSRDVSKRKILEEEHKNSEEHISSILSSITDAFIVLDKDWNLTYINRRANVLFNRSNQKLIGKSFWESFPDVKENEKKYNFSNKKNKNTKFEYFSNRLKKWLNVKIYPSKKGLSIFYVDITEDKIQRTILEVEQNAIIENNKRTKRLNEIFDEAIVKMESIIPGMFCTVLKVSENGKTLTNFSAPSVSQKYLDEIEGIEIADNLGSCSTAVFRNEIIITSNIKKDSKWNGFTEIADQEGFVSCWSFPIISSKGIVLAVLAVYFKKEAVPTNIDLKFLSKISDLLSNLIEGRKKEDEINKLSLIAKNTSKAVFITGLDQRITWINPAFTEMTGYVFDEVIGKKPIKLLEGKKSDPDTMRYLKRQMIDNESFTLNTIFHKKNGEFYWSRITGQPMFDEAGHVNQYFAIQEDTTARKLSKIDLQDSEKRYRALFHSNSQPMYIYDKSTLKFIEVNESAVNTYGYSTEEFNEMITSDLLEDHIKANYDSTKDKINYRNNVLNSTEILTDICIHKTKTGKLINVEIIRNEMNISGKPSILVIINDITKKLITEKKLIQSNERFTLASKAVNEAIWDLNLNTNKLYWTEGITQLFGYENPNGIITPENWKNFIHPDDYQMVKLDFDSTLMNKKADYWNSEYRFLKKDSAFAYVLDSAYIVRNENGDPIRVIGAMQDITKQKNFENQKLTLISETQEHERKRFSMELHDGLAQHLVALNLYLSQIEEDKIVETSTLNSCFAVLKTSMNQTRALCYSLTPPELDHGFLLALQAMFERLKAVKAFDVNLNISTSIKDSDFQDVDKYNLYRIIQEFINNSIKHSGGSLISCKLTSIKHVIRIHLSDNGKGFDLNQKSNSLGLKNIEQRACLAKIQYVLTSKIEKGTEMRIELK